MSSVIFIGNPGYERLDYYSKPKLASRLWNHVSEAAVDLPRRIALSFVPPFVSPSAKRVHVDLLGPLVAFVFLSVLLHYGHAFKEPSAAMKLLPSVLVAIHCILTPTACFVVATLGGASLTLVELTALLGYGLYGYLLTLGSAHVFADDSSNFVFFLSLIVFGGSSAFRIILILLVTIPRPGARLLVCTFVSLVHILFIIFIHFAYMHRTFAYGQNNNMVGPPPTM